jgi:hypothetical protein
MQEPTALVCFEKSRRIIFWNKAIQSEKWILGYSYAEITQKLLGHSEEKEGAILKETDLKYFNFLFQNRQGKHKNFISACARLISNTVFERDFFLKKYRLYQPAKLKFLSTLWRHIRGTEAWLHAFLTSIQNGGEWSTSRFCRERNLDSGTHCMRVRVSSRDDLDVCGKMLNRNTRAHARTRTHTHANLQTSSKQWNGNLTPPGTPSHPQPCPVLLHKPDNFLSQGMCFISFCLLQLRTAVPKLHCVKSLKVNNTQLVVRLNNTWYATSCLEREHCIANTMTSRSMLCI